MSLEVYDLYSGYGEAEVLHGVSLKVNKGEIVSVIGPNGAGKTTLLKTIFGLIKPWRGKKIFEGEDITGARTDILLKRGMAYVFQERGIIPDMTVMENLEMGAYTIKDYKVVKERMEKIFETFPPLRERKNFRAGLLSGGERTMLAISRALMLNPKFVLLDEPSLGLDPRFVSTVFKKIKEMNKAGVTILISEQNAYKALNISDRSYILESGQIKLEDFSEKLFKDEKVVSLYFGGIY